MNLFKKKEKLPPIQQNQVPQHSPQHHEQQPNYNYPPQQNQPMNDAQQQQYQQQYPNQQYPNQQMQQQQMPPQYPVLPPIQSNQQNQNYQPMQQIPNNPIGGQYYPQGTQPLQYNTGQPIAQAAIGLFHLQNQKIAQMNNQNNKMQMKMNGYQAIDSVKSIVICQQVIPMQEKGCCESEMSYIIRPGNEEAKDSNREPLFKIVEQEECCQRFVCGGGCRPFELHAINLKGEREVFLKAVRQHKYTFLCCQRPYVDVFRLDSNFKHTKIGTIVHKFECFKIKVEVYDGKGQRIWQFKDPYCQLGVACRPFCCDACQKAKLQIKDAYGEKVGEMKNTPQSCTKCCGGEQDRFSVQFPEKSDFNDKLLLMFTGIFMKYRYFEDNAVCSTDDGPGLGHIY